MFDCKPGIALQAMQGNWASSLSEGEVSWFFSSCGRNLADILELRQGWTFKTHVCSATSGLLSSYDGYLRVYTRLGRKIRTLLEVRRESEDHFLVGTVILGFITIFKKCQASPTFEALNSVSL